MLLAAVLAKLLFTGVKVPGVVNVPPLTMVKVPDMADNNNDPPMLPLMCEMNTVLPLSAGLLIRTEIMAELKLSITVAEAEAFDENNAAFSDAFISGGAEMSGERKVFVIST